MKPMVLCISRTALEEQDIDRDSYGLFDFNLNKVNQEDFHFINRKVVDNKDGSWHTTVGQILPQILPYILVTDGKGKYLSYSRNGTETRLHGSRSIGIGGHIDITDMFEEREPTQEVNIELTIMNATFRELSEELKITGYVEQPTFNKIIVDTSNAVGRVHVGLFSILSYAEVEPQEELHDPQWLTLNELKATIDDYESWSQIILKELV